MAAGQGFASMPAPEHRLASAIGGLNRWSRVNSTPARTAALAPARAGMRAKLAREADPDGVLPPEELEQAIARLKSAHMRRMSLASAKKRRRSA